MQTGHIGNGSYGGSLKSCTSLSWFQPCICTRFTWHCHNSLQHRVSHPDSNGHIFTAFSAASGPTCQEEDPYFPTSRQPSWPCPPLPVRCYMPYVSLVVYHVILALIILWVTVIIMWIKIEPLEMMYYLIVSILLFGLNLVTECHNSSLSIFHVQPQASMYRLN